VVCLNDGLPAPHRQLPKDVRLNIRKTLRGAVDSQSDNGETVKLGEAITTDNPMFTWEITLKTGSPTATESGSACEPLLP